MSGLTFRLKAAPPWRLDMSPLTPDRLAGMSARDIGRVGLLSGNSRIPAGDLFDVARAILPTSASRATATSSTFIGSGMDRGRLTVEGSAGAYCGLNLRGGELILRGQAGPYAGIRTPLHVDEMPKWNKRSMFNCSRSRTSLRSTIETCRTSSSRSNTARSSCCKRATASEPAPPR